MNEKNLNRQIKEKLLAAKDQLIADVGLVRIMTIKAKYFDQIPTRHYSDDPERSIPGNLEIIGQWNSHVIARDENGHLLKCQIWDYAASCVPQNSDWSIDKDLVNEKMKELDKSLPQLFSD